MEASSCLVGWSLQFGWWESWRGISRLCPLLQNPPLKKKEKVCQNHIFGPRRKPDPSLECVLKIRDENDIFVHEIQGENCQNWIKPIYLGLMTDIWASATGPLVASMLWWIGVEDPAVKNDYPCWLQGVSAKTCRIHHFSVGFYAPVGTAWWMLSWNRPQCQVVLETTQSLLLQSCLNTAFFLVIVDKEKDLVQENSYLLF